MVCAFLSAIYDYDTDWKPIRSLENSVFLPLLRQFVEDRPARDKAEKLFLMDRSGCLSKGALERGSGAFRLYCAVIGSKWLAKYSSGQLDEFGRLLQQIDDLLDLFRDKKHGDVNCFLTPGKPRYVQEVRQFMVSDFFAKLVKHAQIYVAVRWYCQHICLKISDALPPWVKIASVFRPLTCVYAASAVFVGFKVAAKVDALAICAAMAFSLVTGSIMAFNDFVEREHDRKKGKYFASTYTWLLLCVLGLCALVITALLIMTAFGDPWLASFIATVWLLGLLYSHPAVRKWYIWQTVIVAVLSACPVLCGCVCAKQASYLALVIFVLLSILIFIRELAKDVEDVRFDRGFKETLPMRQGVPITAFYSLLLVQVAMVLFCLSPRLFFAGYSLAILQLAVGLMIFNPSCHRWVKRGVDMALCCILILLLVS